MVQQNRGSGSGSLTPSLDCIHTRTHVPTRPRYPTKHPAPQPTCMYPRASIFRRKVRDKTEICVSSLEESQPSNHHIKKVDCLDLLLLRLEHPSSRRSCRSVARPGPMLPRRHVQCLEAILTRGDNCALFMQYQFRVLAICPNCRAALVVNGSWHRTGSRGEADLLITL